jgi:hypothetical protein
MTATWHKQSTASEAHLECWNTWKRIPPRTLRL